MTFDDPNAGQIATQFLIEKLQWLTLDHIIDFVIKHLIIGVNRVHVLSSTRDHLECGWIFFFRQGINFEIVSPHLYSCIRFPIDKEPP